MTKKTTAKKAPKPKATPKAAPKAAAAKKAPQKPQGETRGKDKAPPAKKRPGFVKNFPTEYIVGTEDYAALVEKHNELFGTVYLKWRVKPQVFFTIHQRVLQHYDEK